MSNNDITLILNAIQDMRDDHERVHEDLTNKIAALESNLQPVYDIYKDVKGAGRIVAWIIGVFTVVGGAILMMRSLFITK